MNKIKEALGELKDEYNKCNELFDIAFKLNNDESTRNELSRKTASYMADIMQTLGFLIDELESLKREVHL